MTENKSVSADELLQRTGHREALLTAIIIAQASNILGMASRQILSQWQLTQSQWTTLWTLMVAGKPMTATEISHVVPLRNHSIGTLLDRLHERKLIRRRRSTSDRRNVNVSLTAEGVELLQEVVPNLLAMGTDVFQTMSPEETQLLYRLLLEISRNTASWLRTDPDRVWSTVERLIPGVHYSQIHTTNQRKGAKTRRRPV